MSKVYAFDDYGNKHETMKKDEIEQSIGAGGVRECVLTGCITYNKVDINFNYTGTLPSEADISRLLAFGVDPENNKLTEAEVTSYLSIGMFSIHFYYLDAEIYVTNVNGTYLAYSKMGEGTFHVYPRKVEKNYFVKANDKTTSGEYVVANAVNATNATIAQYASEDTSKGTIEERLTSLGFKEGFFIVNTYNGGAATFITNSIKKQGKYVIANLSINESSGGITLISVPNEFKPNKETNVMVKYKTSLSGSTNNVSIYTLKTDGTISLTGFEMGIEIVNAGWEIN